MPLLLRMRRSTMRTATKYVGRLALALALICMSLEMIRIRGWGVSQVEHFDSTAGLSVGEFWASVASVSVAAAFGLLILGLLATSLSRSRFLDETEPEEEIDVAAVSQRIRNFEEFQVAQAGRGTQPVR